MSAHPQRESDSSRKCHHYSDTLLVFLWLCSPALACCSDEPPRSLFGIIMLLHVGTTDNAKSPLPRLRPS